MLFNSTVFLQFFAAFLLLYYLCRNSIHARNALILAASWLFYGWWDYRFLGLLIFSGGFDYAAGLLVARAGDLRRKKWVLASSIAVNLALLGFFKYYDFFVESFVALLARLHVDVSSRTLGIILPVGISFYTFQSLSYVIDVYRGQVRPTRSLVHYLAYVSFFPQLVAGPISRAQHLLPQFQRTLTINREMLATGLGLVIWGLFKKVAMADNLAPMVDMVFNNPAATGPAVVCGTVAFAFQIYGDFSGYSDIARGIARLLGFDLMANFNLPYFATDLRDFWRRWHISLSTWLRDYLYISFGGNRSGRLSTMRNLLLTMLLGGLWHGAAWHFVLWGAWHGIGLIVTRWWQEARRGRLPVWLSMPMTFLFVLYGWLLFRAGSMENVVRMTAALGDWRAPSWLPHFIISLFLFVLPVLAAEAWEAKANRAEPAAWRMPGWVRTSLQGLLVLSLVLFWEKKAVPFIYFQF
jgi:D-alanyl-lipoteichoic acid acyltransferase DltB (MBOAT superfamily)